MRSHREANTLAIRPIIKEKNIVPKVIMLRKYNIPLALPFSFCFRTLFPSTLEINHDSPIIMEKNIQIMTAFDTRSSAIVWEAPAVF